MDNTTCHQFEMDHDHDDTERAINCTHLSYKEITPLPPQPPTCPPPERSARSSPLLMNAPTISSLSIISSEQQSLSIQHDKTDAWISVIDVLFCGEKTSRKQSDVGDRDNECYNDSGVPQEDLNDNTTTQPFIGTSLHHITRRLIPVTILILLLGGGTSLNMQQVQDVKDAVKLLIPSKKVIFFSFLSVAPFPIIWVVLHLILIIDQAEKRMLSLWGSSKNTKTPESSNASFMKTSDEDQYRYQQLEKGFLLTTKSSRRLCSRKKSKRKNRYSRWHSNWKPILPTIQE